MGQFSWYTQDEKHARIIDDRKLSKPIYMIGQMPDGSMKTYVENDMYDGYGTFGGKDYYEFMAEMNGFGSDREKGIELAFDESSIGMSTKWKHPTLTLEEDDYHDGVAPESDDEQGWGFTRDDLESGIWADVPNYIDEEDEW